MDGMTYVFGYAIGFDDDPFTFSDHISIDATSVIGQAYLSHDFDQTDPHDAGVRFLDCEFLDDNGSPTRRNFPDNVPAFSQNRLIRVDFLGFVSNGAFGFVVNLFFWPSVV